MGVSLPVYVPGMTLRPGSSGQKHTQPPSWRSSGLSASCGTRVLTLHSPVGPPLDLPTHRQAGTVRTKLLKDTAVDTRLNP